MTDQSKTAYVVPCALWDRMLHDLKMLKSNQQSEEEQQQSGGAIAGLNANGTVNSDRMLKMMAVNQSIQQNAYAPFIEHADTLTKTILSDPLLSVQDKIRLSNSLITAQDHQMATARHSKSGPKSTPPSAAAAAATPSTTQPTRKRLYPQMSDQRTPVHKRSRGTPPPSYRSPTREQLDSLNKATRSRIQTLIRKNKDIQSSPSITPKKKVEMEALVTKKVLNLMNEGSPYKMQAKRVRKPPVSFTPSDYK